MYYDHAFPLLQLLPDSPYLLIQLHAPPLKNKQKQPNKKNKELNTPPPQKDKTRNQNIQVKYQ